MNYMCKEYFDERPQLSVLMSVYNDARHLSESVESILNQTYDSFEFIIIDDGSTDDSTTILKKYATNDSRIRLFRQENKGLIASLNIGLQKCRNEFVARMDSDDISLPDRFKLQMEFLSNNPQISVVGGQIVFIDDYSHVCGGVLYPVGSKTIDNIMPYQCCLCHPSVMYRKNAVLSAGGYRQKIDKCREAMYCEDYDLWLRLILAGRSFYNLNKVILKYRATNPKSISNTQKQRQSKNVQSIRSYFFEKRTSSQKLPSQEDKILFPNEYEFINTNMASPSTSLQIEALRGDKKAWLELGKRFSNQGRHFISSLCNLKGGEREIPPPDFIECIFATPPAFLLSVLYLSPKKDNVFFKQLCSFSQKKIIELILPANTNPEILKKLEGFSISKIAYTSIDNVWLSALRAATGRFFVIRQGDEPLDLENTTNFLKGNILKPLIQLTRHLVLPDIQWENKPITTFRHWCFEWDWERLGLGPSQYIFKLPIKKLIIPNILEFRNLSGYALTNHLTIFYESEQCDLASGQTIRLPKDNDHTEDAVMLEIFNYSKDTIYGLLPVLDYCLSSKNYILAKEWLFRFKNLFLNGISLSMTSRKALGHAIVGFPRHIVPVEVILEASRFRKKEMIVDAFKNKNFLMAIRSL